MSYNWISCYSKPLAENSICDIKESSLVEKRLEINAWLNQLKREFPNEEFYIQMLNEGYNVVLACKENEEAFNIVDNLPYNWDYLARKELGKDYFNKMFKHLVGTNDKNS